MRQLFQTLLLVALWLPANGWAVSGSVAATDSMVTDSLRHRPLTETGVQLGEVVVTGLTGRQHAKESPIPVAWVSHNTLEAQPSTNIIDALSRQPGISQITTGGGIAKPVIRGLGYNRIIVVADGIRQEGQQWGDEHGIEVDANAVYSAEIIKGPASLQYGSDAMAGVMLFHTTPTPALGQMRLHVSTGYQSNNGLADYTVNFAGNRQGFVWNSRYSGKLAHAYQNRYDGRVYGSGFREQAISQLMGLNRAWGHIHLTLSYLHLSPGIIEGERDVVTGRFTMSTPDGEATATHHALSTYGHTLPYQHVHHYKAVLDQAVHVGDGMVKLLVGYQQNRRQEYEDAAAPEEPGLDFMLHTVNYDAHYLLPSFDGWKMMGGMAGMWQQSLNKGTEYLIPAYRLFDYGAYATFSRKVGKYSVSGGLRYDHRHLHSEGLMDDGIERFSDFSRGFDGLTGSLGVTCSVTSRLNVRLNLARGFRAPSINELASNGIHEGTQRYETGDTQLHPEHSWQFDVGVDYTSRVWSATLSLFANRIDHYIYSHRLTAADGQPMARDGVAAYQFAAGDARLLGGELQVDVHPLPHMHFSNSFSYVNSVQLHQPRESRYLPMTPAPCWHSELRYEFVCGGHTFDNLFAKAAVETCLRQNHYYAANATETATPSYTLLHVYAGTDILCRGRRVAALYVSCENLADRAYQSHLSRLKYLPVNPVTGRTGVYNMGRNFSVKLVFPIEL